MDLEAGALINEFLRDAKDARQANILVEVGPPDRGAECRDLPVSPFGGRRPMESREPIERHADLAPVVEEGVEATGTEAD
jgi:hypothetical protein